MAEPTTGEKAISSDFTDKWLAAQLAKGNADPRPDQITAPPDLKYITYFDPKHPENPVWFVPNPTYDENSPKSTVYGSAEGGYFRLDANGNPISIREPNADSLITNAVDRQIKEADRNARARNEAAGKGYVTDVERQRFDQDAARIGLDQATLNQRINEFAATQKASDERDRIDKQVKEQQIAASVAGVAKTGAETEQIKEQTALLRGKTEADVAESQARAKLATQQAEDLIRKGKQPTILSQGVEGQSIYTQAPTGEITSQMRQGYVPKTMGEIAARTGQISAAMQAKAQQLYDKTRSDPAYTAEMADADYQKWMDQVVAPENQTINAATQEAMFQRSKDQAAMAAQAYNAAAQAGTSAIRAYEATKDRVVGERAAEVMNQVARGGNLKNVDWSNAAFYEAPDIQDVQQKAVNETLARIYPQGVPQGGAQAVANFNVPEGLNMTQYRPSAMAGAPGAPAAAAAGGGEAPGAAAALTPEQQIARRLASFQTEAATNQGGGGVNGATPFQGIGSNPMAAAMARQQAEAEAIPEPEQEPVAAAPAARRAPAPSRGAAAAPIYSDAAARNAAMGLGAGGIGETPPYSDAAARAASGLGAGGIGPEAPVPTPSFDFNYGGGAGLAPGNITPQTNPFPGVQGLNVNGLNVNGLNVSGLNLGGTVNGVPWADTGVNSYTPPQPAAVPQPNAFAPPQPTPVPQPNAFGGVQGLNIQGLNLNGVPYDPYGNYMFPQ